MTANPLLPELTAEERIRYARQLAPGALSETGQRRLKGASALVTRVGGMGGPAALSLVTAGIGRIVLAHSGPLIEPDLNRQILGDENGLGHSRANQFARRLRAINRFVEVVSLDHEPDEDEARSLAGEVDLILACPPNFEERARLNRAAVHAGIPLVDAAQWGMVGTLMVLQAGRSACFTCVHPTLPEFEELFPVVGAISAAIGSLAALEAIKILSGEGEPIWGRMLVVDGFRGSTQQIELQADPTCSVCGPRRSPTREIPPCAFA